ncbi:MAG: hypothetical protein Q4E03_01290 [Trueperella sp.]|nr:hypothetical protein [Trueperella sp.]
MDKSIARINEAADLVLVGYHGAENGAELERLCGLVGVPLSYGNQPGVLNFSDAGAGKVIASFAEVFAPYFARGEVCLDLQADSADLLELLAAVGATVRGRVVGVVGAQGGAGVSTVAANLARQLAEAGACGLIDLNPASAGIDLRLAISTVPGKRWADLRGRGAILAGRLVQALPEWHGVRVLSADERASVPLELGARAISAVAQIADWTVLDLSPSATVPETVQNSWLEWCDLVLLVTRSDAVSLAEAAVAIGRLAAETPFVIVATAVSSRAEAAHISQTLGGCRVFPLRRERSAREDLDHGVAPGDRTRTRYARDLAAITAHCQQVP